jgi:hypothetical protein
VDYLTRFIADLKILQTSTYFSKSPPGGSPGYQQLNFSAALSNTSLQFPHRSKALFQSQPNLSHSNAIHWLNTVFVVIQTTQIFVSNRGLMISTFSSFWSF